MTNICQTCEHFGPDGTWSPVYLLHSRFMQDDWSCSNHSAFSDKQEEEDDE